MGLKSGFIQAVLFGCLFAFPHPAAAFNAPLTDITARITTNGFNSSVEFSVFDAQQNSSISSQRLYEGRVIGYWTIPRVIVSGGIVAWYAKQQGGTLAQDAEVGYALYDPARSSWRVGWQSYRGNSLSFWTNSLLSVEGGTVSWKASLTDTVSSRDSEITFAHYDARQGRWITGRRRYQGSSVNQWNTSDPITTGGRVIWQARNEGSSPTWDREIALAQFDLERGAWMQQVQTFTGSPLSFWNVSALLTGDKLVAWQAETEGAFSPFNIVIGYSIYDPARHQWQTRKKVYEGQINDLWSVTNLMVQSQAVRWFASRRTSVREETRGYHTTLGTWRSQPTQAAASFVVSTIKGPAPLGIWFGDQSLGATSWDWEFGDGTRATGAFPYHVYDRPGVYRAQLTVTGPQGSDTTFQTITVGAPPGALQFLPGSARLDDNQFRVIITGLPSPVPLIVEVSTNLVDWEIISSNWVSQSSLEFLDSRSMGRNARWYRASIP